MLFIILRQFHQIGSLIPLFILLFALAVNGLELATWYLPNDRISDDRPNRLKIMSFNILVKNYEVDRIVRSIISTDPDLATLIEIEPEMMKNIERMTKERFPYSFRASGGALAVLSKLPLEDSRGEKFTGSNDTNLVTHINYRNQRIEIIATHPFVPVKYDTFTRRNLHLNALANHLKDRSEPTILLGDFNLTPWSPYYRQFIDKTALHNTRLGFGILPTWIRPSTTVKLPKLLIPFLNIPIDHIFVTKDFKVATTYIGDNANSDHSPIICELVIK
jgi:endonuclease/exonuclease/phosphatase (EEP) superfamily protein YafD